MRVFVAAYPPADAVAHLVRFSAQLRTGRAAARLTRPETWHVTLAFLGDLPDERLPVLTGAVDLAAGTASALRVAVAGGGSFGHGRASVLWAGLTGDVTELVELARTLRRALARARLPYDRKPPTPHLTLARPGHRLTPAELAEDKAVLADYRGPEWTIDTLRTIQSHPGPTPTYQELHRSLLRHGPTSPALREQTSDAEVGPG